MLPLQVFPLIVILLIKNDIIKMKDYFIFPNENPKYITMKTVIGIHANHAYNGRWGGYVI
ncbi:hypothetical protein WMZ97_07995 [Lentibacillus sp. N15]